MIQNQYDIVSTLYLQNVLENNPNIYVSFVHSDEEEAEEAEEDKDKDSLSSANSSRNPTPKLPSKPSRTIDLGAAANFGKLEINNTSEKPASSVAQPTLSAGNSDLVDLFSGHSNTTVTSQPFQAPPAPVAPTTDKDSFFADFASAPAGGGTIGGSEHVNFNNGKNRAHTESGILENVWKSAN